MSNPVITNVSTFGQRDVADILILRFETIMMGKIEKQRHFSECEKQRKNGINEE